MRYVETGIDGVLRVEIEAHADDRGFFARTWCFEELTKHGLDAALAQCSISFNHRRGIVRGMHYQEGFHAETKLVRCTSGRIWDVALDLRRDSPTYLRWTAHELSADNHVALLIPQGCAHGFQTLEDASEVLYMISKPYAPASARGVRWNDPAFGIEWPVTPAILSERDASWENYSL